MPDAITNTSPLVYLHRIQTLEWLPVLFDEIWAPSAVMDELAEGRRRGFAVPDPEDLTWLQVVAPTSPPSEWLSADLGAGELAAITLGLEHHGRILILDDALARRTAQAAGLTVWGTLKILLEAKNRGLTERIEPLVQRLVDAGLWVSSEIRRRILDLAREP
jgi:predicted nucleic acid-binding protein